MKTKDSGLISFLLAGIILLLSASVLHAQEQKGFVSFPVSFKGYSIDKDSEQFLQMYFCAWRSIEGKWKYLGLRGKLEDNKDELQLRMNAGIPDGKLNLNATLKKTGPRQFQAVCDLSTTKDVDLKYVAAAISTFKHFESPWIHPAGLPVTKSHGSLSAIRCFKPMHHAPSP